MKIDKSWYIKPKDKNFPRQELAGGIVLRKEKNKILIALVGDKKFPSYILPKGRIEKGESKLSAARREVSEETGLGKLIKVEKLEIVERYTFDKTTWNVYHYFIFLTDQKFGSPNLQKGEEDYFTEWFNIDDLPLIFWPEQKELIMKNRDKINKLLTKK